MKTLVFAPHPDDEIIGCGGYLAKMIGNNDVVDVAYVLTPSKVRKKEISLVQQKMRFNKLYFLNESGRSQTVTKTTLSKFLHVIRDSNPNRLLIPHKNETDGDHRYLSDLILGCYFLADSDFLIQGKDKPSRTDSVLGYEVWTPISSPQLHIDITKQMGIKRSAMKLYPSQLNAKDYISMFEGLNKYRAITSGTLGFSEAFEIYKMNEEH